jgi:hypothetical protein
MGERREHPPLPGTLQVIPATSLRGMEQPVRSFRSFIRTAPLHSGPDGSKPLPPTPTSPEGPVLTVSPSPAQHPLGQSISDTVWSIPATWDDPSTLKLDFQASPFSTARSHGLLLPEPSPGITDSDEQRPWPFNLSNSQPSNLAFRDEFTTRIPSPLRPRLYKPPSESAALSLLGPAPPNMLSMPDSTKGSSKVSINADTRKASTSRSPDAVLRVSNLSTKQKAFASLGIDTGDQDIMRGQWDDLFDSAHTKEDFLPYLLVQGKELESASHQIPSLLDTSDGTDIGEKLQQLSVSHDYHNVLVDQYQDTHDFSVELLASERSTKEGPDHTLKKGPSPPPKERGLMPRPLSWRKDSASSSSGQPGDTTSFTPANTVQRDVGARKRYRKMPSWVPHHKATQELEQPDLDKDKFPSGRASEGSGRKQNPGLDGSRPKKKDMHFSGLVPHIRGFISHTKPLRVSIGTKSGRSTSITASEPRPAPGPSSSVTSIPLLRLPGGLALVRQSSTPVPTPSHSTSVLDLPKRLELPRWNSYSDFSGYGYPAKSQLSLPAVAPAVAVNRRMRTSISSAPSIQSLSNASSPPTSPLVREVAFPRTPPPLPPAPKLPPTFSPWSERSTDFMPDSRADSATEEEPQKRGFHVGLLDRARDVHEAWKRHNKNVKHEKLKQSIRVLGPTDPTVSASYVKREGRMSLLDGRHRIRVPGYMSAGPL